VSTPVRSLGSDREQAIQNMRILQDLSRRREMERRLQRSLTEEEIEQLDGNTCMHCGGYHARACPRVKRLEFHPNGTPAVVEFWPAREVDWTGVLFEDQGDPDESSFIRVDDLDEDISLLISTLTGRDGLVGVRNALRRHPCREHVAQAVHRLEALIEVARHGTVDSPDATVSEGPGQG